MKKYSKILSLVLALAMILPGFAQAAPVAEEVNLKRLEGLDRVETSIKVSKEAYEKADTVVLAGYNGEADALTGTLLAKDKNAPVLLTYKDKLDTDLVAELNRLDAKNVYILGGDTVVFPAVETALKDAGFKTTRLKGDTRVETAIAIANEVFGSATPAEAFAVEYNSLADALAIGPVAANKKAPILITYKDTVPAKTEEAMKAMQVKDLTVVGGENAVSEKGHKALQALTGKTVARVAGSNRDLTSLEIANKYFTNPKAVVVANGYKYADALVGGYFAAKIDAPILLTNTNTMHANVLAKIKDLQLDTYVLGGMAAVSSDVYAKVQEALTGEVVAPGEFAIQSVSAITANKVEVTFNSNPKDLKVSDFNVTGGLTVIEVKSSTGNKATLTFSTDMTDGAEYELQLLDAEDNVISKSTFKYDLGDVASISLTKSKFEVGENVKNFLKVFDDKGVEISTADYNVSKVESSNTAVVKETSTAGEVAALGTSNLRFEITYKDGSVSKSDFIRIDVEEAVTADLAGYVLDTSATPYDNTEDYRINGALAKTSLFESDSAQYLAVYADDSKNNPEIEALNLSTGGDYTVESKSPAIISVEQDGTGAELTPVSKGKANIVITGKNNYKKTLTIEVKADAEYKDLLVGATSLKLSDEAVADAVGVNQEEVKLQWVDQYGVKKGFTISSPTVADNEVVQSNAIKTGDKLVISVSQSDDAFKLTDLTAGTSSSTLSLKAEQNKTVKNASIRVSYYADANANKPTTQKVIATTVVDVDATAPAHDYETILSTPAIDPNNPLANKAVVTAYALDSNKNRIADVSDDVTLTFADSVEAIEKVWFNLTAKGTVAFEDKARKQMVEEGTLKLEYTVAGSSSPHGKINVAYDNSFMAPNKATVTNNAIVINTKPGGDFASGITVEELLFGKILADSNQLVIDGDSNKPHSNSPSIGVKKGFTGYANKPILSFLDKKGKAVVSGAELYALAVDNDTTGNGYIVDTTDGSYDADAVFEVKYTITNAKDLSQADGTDTTAGTLDDVFTISSGNQASFTMVITEITVANDTRTSVKAKNLLESPKAVNVVLSNK